MTTTERILILVVLIGIFFLDAYTPLGFSIWLLYLFPLLYVSLKAKRTEGIFFTSLISVFIIADFFISPPGIPPLLEMLNRIFYVGAIWILSYLNIRRLESEKKLSASSEKIKESERNLRTIFESSNDAILLHDPDGKIFDVNRRMLEMYGIEYQEALSLSIGDLSSPANPFDATFEILNKVVAGEDQFFEWQARRPKDDSFFYVEVFLTRIMIRERTVIMATVHDITQRKQLEDELRLTRFAVEHASVCAYLVGSDAHFLYVNEQACRTLGYSREELLSMTVHDLDPDFPPAVWPNHWAELKKKDGLHFETSHRKKDGTLVPMEMTLNFLAYGGREYNVAFGLEISERKKAEQAVKQAYAGLEEKVRERTRALAEANSELRQEIAERQRAEMALQASEKRFRDLIEATSDWVWEVDDRGVYTYVSPQVQETLGYAPEEVLGKTPFDLMPAEEAERLAPVFEEVVASRQSIFLLENISLHQNGTRVVLESSCIPFFDASGNFKGYRGIDRDISERKRAEEELQKAQRLESIGLLAGGIAHDFNNILTAIQGNIELARVFLPPGDKAAARLAVAEQAAIRARGLSQQLLTFARGGAPITKTTEVSHLVREAVGLALRGGNVRGEYFLPEDLQVIEADESQLIQALSNLAFNAVEAMPEGGVLTVTAANETVPSKNTLGLLPGEYLRIDIKDQGGGIPAEFQQRIFDPYFTTKEGGSGLGLAISFSVIKKHGGTITIDSAPGQGSTFSVILPVSQNKINGAQEEEPGGKTAASGRILVMDDEETVSEVAAEMLRYLGYQVETVKDGREAVSAYRQAREAGEPFAAVIVDLTVPAGMGGKETVRRLLELDPQAKVIVSSGYASDPIMSEYVGYGFKGVIPKPYDLDELGQVLREVVGEKEAVEV